MGARKERRVYDETPLPRAPGARIIPRTRGRHAHGLRGEGRMGVVLQQRYELIAVLGRGSMGTVHRARDLVVNRDVAVKLLAPASLDEAGKARFLREARAAGRLNHPNIVALHDVGETADGAFLVMELVEGSLRELGPQPLEQTVDIARQLALALAHAHANGVVHRDVKPENVLVKRGSGPLTVKLTDFGLASAAGATRLTAQGTVIGTLAYLSPEQALAGEVDGRADLYALGVMLYELVVGRTPFASDRPQVMLSQHIQASPRPPREIDARIPAGLETLILRLLAKRPEDRYATAEAVGAALERIAAGELPPLAAEHGSGVVVHAPPERSLLVGRAADLEQARTQLLRDGVRLLTFTGPGGIGKTRLGLRLLARVSAEFPGGCFFVPLAAVADATLVPSTVARALGAQAAAGLTPLHAIAEHVDDRRALVMLDNFEHLPAAGSFVADLLAACPNLRLLVTSRGPLHLDGEHERAIAPLTLPDPDQPRTAARIGDCGAVELFVRRAREHDPTFSLSDANAVAIARVCERLDGLPLAIELAAARVHLLSPEAMADQLERRNGEGALSLLSGGAADAPERHRTQAAAIAWSYDLLGPLEQALFRSLGVLVGPFTLDAARGVAPPGADEVTGPEGSVLAHLGALVDGSLVKPLRESGGTARFVMLETIREFALGRLSAEDEHAGASRRHFDAFARFVKEQAALLKGATQGDALAALDADLPNLRAALAWGYACAATRAALEMAVTLRWFWLMRGHSTEGRRWLERGLASASIDDALRAEALHVMGNLAQNEGDLEEALEHFETSRRLYQDIGDRVGVAHNLGSLGAVARERGDYERARLLLEGGLTVWKELGRKSNVADALLNLSHVALAAGDDARAHDSAEESLRMMRQLGNRHHASMCTHVLGSVALRRGDLAGAESLMEEALAVRRDLDDAHCSGNSLIDLARIALMRKDRPQARRMLRESIDLLRKAGVRHDIADALEGLGDVAIAEERLESAARLFGAADAIREVSGTVPAPRDRDSHARTLAELRTRIDPAIFRAAWISGRAARLDALLEHEAT
jgi:predicted ATPase